MKRSKFLIAILISAMPLISIVLTSCSSSPTQPTPVQPPLPPLPPIPPTPPMPPTPPTPPAPPVQPTPPLPPIPGLPPGIPGFPGQPGGVTWYFHECGAIPGVPNARYCYDQTTKDATDVLIFNHGLMDSETALTAASLMPSSYGDLHDQMKPARIFTISFGPSWMLTKYLGRVLPPVSATVDNYVNKVLPFLESKYGIKPPFKLMGHSMGGHNSAVLAQSYPALFSKVVLINPMLILDATNPFFDFSCLACYVIKGGYDFAHMTAWFAEKPHMSAVPSMVMACPTDAFNLFPGTQQFAGPALVVDDPGCDHGHFPVPKIMQFLFP